MFEKEMNIRFHNQFVFRAPCYPLSKTADSVKTLITTARHLSFQEAVYLASPSLYYELQKWINGVNLSGKEIDKISLSINKYLLRMSSRCTPFGLFASCSVGEWGERSEIIIADSIRRSSRFDLDFGCRLVNFISNIYFIQQHLLYYANNSMYLIGDHLRYVEYHYRTGKRKHQIVAVDWSEYLDHVVLKARNGVSFSDMVMLLADIGIESNEAKEFIHQLIHDQILISELEPEIVGGNLVERFSETLSTIYNKSGDERIRKIVHLLRDLSSLIRVIDESTDSNIEKYLDLKSKVATIGVDVPENNLFQVDAFRDATATLNVVVQEQLLSAFKFLDRLYGCNSNSSLDQFVSRYYEVYQDREMPLLEIMDTETGIGYPSKDVNGSNVLIDDISFYSNGQNSLQITVTPRDQYLFDKLIEAIKNEKFVVSFYSLDEIKGIKHEIGRMGKTFNVSFKVIDAENGKISVKYFGGASAANLIARFGYGDKRIERLLKDITTFEQNNSEDKVIAEIVHLPQDKVGNILARSVTREYEIPYLAKSILRPENQVAVDDLTISVRRGRIVLRSNRLNKEVLPRLSSAHNYSVNSLPVYKFLCDLQFLDIDKGGLSFNWGVLSKSFKFLPRAEYKNIVLYPATWNLLREDYAPILKVNPGTNFMDEVERWRAGWKMTEQILLKDGDNELLIDLRNELSVRTFISIIKGRNRIELSEFLFNSINTLIKDRSGNAYTNEIIGIVFNEERESIISNAYSAKKTPKNIDVRRTFIPGSEWLYYKIYCGVKTVDDLLVKTIHPVVEQLEHSCLIEKWFFVRFHDPDPHLRIRFFNSKIELNDHVSKVIYEVLNPLVEKGIVLKVISDTYNRELERYGANSIDITEEYFFNDSKSTLELLNISQRESNDDLKWKFAIIKINSILDSFKFSLEGKAELTEILRTTFIVEHGEYKSIKIQLDKKYRGLRLQIEQLLEPNLGSSREGVLFGLLDKGQKQLNEFAEKVIELHRTENLEVSIREFISSIIHMTMNRLFKSRQRTYEMVVYDFLSRIYKSQLARKKDKHVDF